jgi:hypothetical protein
MTEILHNDYVKIEPVKHESFMQSDRQTYDELGIIVAIHPDLEKYRYLKVGDTVKFDGWLAKKFPREGEPGKFDWYVNYQNIVSSVSK